MTLTDFLLARIAEDEEGARVWRMHYRLLKDGMGRPLETTEPLPPQMGIFSARPGHR